MSEPRNEYRQLLHQLAQPIIVNNVPVMPVVGVAYVILATLAAGTVHAAAGLVVLVLGALAVLVIYLALLSQEEDSTQRHDVSRENDTAPPP